jgi:hypothetical protein
VLKVWRDRSDRISVLRVVTLICRFSPLGKTIYDSDTIKLDARPITNLIDGRERFGGQKKPKG